MKRNYISKYVRGANRRPTVEEPRFGTIDTGDWERWEEQLWYGPQLLFPSLSPSRKGRLRICEASDVAEVHGRR